MCSKGALLVAAALNNSDTSALFPPSLGRWVMKGGGASSSADRFTSRRLGILFSLVSIPSSLGTLGNVCVPSSCMFRACEPGLAVVGVPFFANVSGVRVGATHTGIPLQKKKFGREREVRQSFPLLTLPASLGGQVSTLQLLSAFCAYFLSFCCRHCARFLNYLRPKRHFRDRLTASVMKG